MRGDQPVRLRPKTWSVLVYFAGKPGTLVSRDELLGAALGDDHRQPRFLETVNRRGYRLEAQALIGA